jgi:hypothetical protein
VELDATQLETSLADTGLADVVARAVEVLGSRLFRQERAVFRLTLANAASLSYPV